MANGVGGLLMAKHYNKMFTLIFSDIIRNRKVFGWCWSMVPLKHLYTGTYTPTYPTQDAAEEAAIETLKKAQKAKTTKIKFPCNPSKVLNVGMLVEASVNG